MDWKIGAVVGVVVVILLTAFLANGVSLPSFGTAGMSGFFTAVGGARNVTVDLVLEKSAFAIDTKAYSIEAVLVNPSSEITVGSSMVDLSSRETAKLEIKGWKGKVAVNGTLSLDGTAEEIMVDGIRLTPTDKESKILLNGMEFTDLAVRDVSLPSVSFPAAAGYVYISGGKTTVKADSEPVELGSFVGDIRIDTSLRISGTAGKVSIAGKNTVNVE